jgi:hypothetical protein
MTYYYSTIRYRLALGVPLFLGPLVLLVMVSGQGIESVGGSPRSATSILALICGTPVVSLAGCLGLACIFLALSDLQNPSRHRLLGHLRGYGNPVEAAGQIDAEFAAHEGVVTIRDRSTGPRRVGLHGLWVTPSWVVEVRDGHVALARIADLEWVEEARLPTEENRHELNPYEVGLEFGVRVRFTTTREERYRLYLALRERCPGILKRRGWQPRRTADRPACQAPQHAIQASGSA